MNILFSENLYKTYNFQYIEFSVQLSNNVQIRKTIYQHILKVIQLKRNDIFILIIILKIFLI